jgi:hypothetical protein
MKAEKIPGRRPTIASKTGLKSRMCELQEQEFIGKIDGLSITHVSINVGNPR